MKFKLQIEHTVIAMGNKLRSDVEKLLLLTLTLYDVKLYFIGELYIQDRYYFRNELIPFAFVPDETHAPMKTEIPWLKGKNLAAVMEKIPNPTGRGFTVVSKGTIMAEFHKRLLSHTIPSLDAMMMGEMEYE